MSIETEQIIEEYHLTVSIINSQMGKVESESTLPKMVQNLINQLDNAYNEASFYKKQYEKYQSMI